MSAHRQGVWFWRTCPSGLVTCANCGGASRDKCHPPPRCGPLPKSLTGPQNHIFSRRERWISEVQNLILILQYKLKMGRGKPGLACEPQCLGDPAPAPLSLPRGTICVFGGDLTLGWLSQLLGVPGPHRAAELCLNVNVSTVSTGGDDKAGLTSGVPSEQADVRLPRLSPNASRDGEPMTPKQLRAFPANSGQQACQVLAGPCGRPAAGPGAFGTSWASASSPPTAHGSMSATAGPAVLVGLVGVGRHGPRLCQVSAGLSANHLEGSLSPPLNTRT